MSRFDIVVFGATGFTGRLVAQYLAQATQSLKNVKWAIAGRNPSKLNETKSIILQETGIDISDTPLIIADSSDTDAIEQMVKQTQVVVSTVGPYLKYGEKLVSACARNGIHYCDLTGETIWVRKMIDQYEEIAKQNRARIVHCCGFDSIPSDLGCFMMVEHMKRISGKQTHQVKCVVDKLKGGASGGTLASMFGIMDYAYKHGTKEIGSRYLLNPIGNKPNWESRDQSFVGYDKDFKTWTAPFVMASCNTRVVRRSNALLNNQYGAPFSYTEAQAIHGTFAPVVAFIQSIGLMLFTLFAYYPLTRGVLQKVVPKPGEGPSKEARDKGKFRLLFCAKSAVDDKSQAPTVIKGAVSCLNADPGYKGTAIMLAETALCLALDQHKLPERFGSLTPATACGSVLISRLNQAGISFQVEDQIFMMSRL